jgi:uncharacterized membrane protein
MTGITVVYSSPLQLIPVPPLSFVVAAGLVYVDVRGRRRSWRFDWRCLKCGHVTAAVDDDEEVVLDSRRSRHPHQIGCRQRQ